MVSRLSPRLAPDITVGLGPQDVDADPAGRLPVLFPPRLAAAPAGSLPPPQQRLPQALVDAMANANAALLAVWAAKDANDANTMAVKVHGTLMQVRAWRLHLAEDPGVKQRNRQGCWTELRKFGHVCQRTPLRFHLRWSAWHSALTSWCCFAMVRSNQLSIQQLVMHLCILCLHCKLISDNPSCPASAASPHDQTWISRQGADSSISAFAA